MFSRTLNKVSAIFVVALLVITACDQPANVQQEQEKPSDAKLEKLMDRMGDPIDGQFIVVFDNSAAQSKAALQKRSQKINTMMGKYSISKDAVKSRYKNVLGGFTAKLSNEQLAELRNDKSVEYVEQDRIVMLSPPKTNDHAPWWCYYYGIGCHDDGGGSEQVTPYGIDRVGGATASSGTAWVIDTGIDLDHDDLNVDQSRSATFVSGTSSPNDGNGHGTHVAGTIAALDNDIDVVGVAAGASVVAVRVLDSNGSGSYSGVIDGIDYVAANASPGDVANMSLGGGTSTSVDNAVSNAAGNGIYFALAAGNDGADANNSSPARVNGANIYTISAIDSNDNFASFSNYGNPPVDYAAPGVDVESLWINNSTNTISGTSMASPHAAGVLLVTGGNPTSDGTANGDPDGTADPIIHQ
ncbi:Peptidase inhibitor I9 [Fodinibius salinus]|uniref:Peptidase inhibitor I9 n=1 Tax=Fodinibius salinus TaxID=860790 RepID=A0A5D3YKV5_9BACT|nr:S8 family serine peptidase [Fodinibius salinus]TYP94070.1 Peptidase inhibitor I9 [Fodinibius salinus]